MAQAKKRQDDRYVAKVMVDGKAKYVYGKTIKERDEKVRELKRKMDKGLDISADRDTFGYWREKWLRVKKSEVSAKYHETLIACSKKLDSIAHLQISKMRAMDLQDILLDMADDISPTTGKPYSQRTIKAVRDIASSVAHMAIENRVMDYNPFVKIKLPKAQKEPEKREALTPEQQRWIVETPHRAQTAAMIMMYAGLRRGELLALQWTDIDLTAKTININKAVVMEKGKSSVKQGGKTDAATRTVYMPDALVEYLKKQPRTNFLVCPSATGKLMSQSAWRKLWESYLLDLIIKYGDFAAYKKWNDKHPGERPSKFHPEELPLLIPHFTAHWLRHTYITNMYLAGVDVLTTMQQAGHSNIKVTMDIYTHLDSQHKEKNIEKLNKYLKSEIV